MGGDRRDYELRVRGGGHGRAQVRPGAARGLPLLLPQSRQRRMQLQRRPPRTLSAGRRHQWQDRVGGGGDGAVVGRWQLGRWWGPHWKGMRAMGVGERSRPERGWVLWGQVGVVEGQHHGHGGKSWLTGGGENVSADHRMDEHSVCRMTEEAGSGRVPPVWG